MIINKYIHNLLVFSLAGLIQSELITAERSLWREICQICHQDVYVQDKIGYSNCDERGVRGKIMEIN